MKKSVLLVLIMSLLTIVLSPRFLSADDAVTLTRVSDAKAVETIIPEPAPQEATPVVAKAPVAGAAVAKPPIIPNYTVTNYVGSKQEYVNTYANLSYSAIYKYNKMIYGHNTYNLLGSLSRRVVGETITITEGGIARNYRVAAIVLYEKTADGNLNGDPKLMASIANTAMGHSAVMLTCAGTPYGNGDASHRLAVYVDAI